MKVLITGASSGIGLAIAHHLHNKGFEVTGIGRREIDLPFNYVKMDITDHSQVRSFYKMYNNFDCLINSAGMGIAGSLEETSLEEAKEQFEINFFASFSMIKEILPYFRERNKGKIINITSIGGLISLPFQSFYCASKFALEGLLEALQMEVRPFNIDVIQIRPGDFATGFTQNRKPVKDSPVYQAKKTLSIMEKDELNGPHPQKIAKLVEKLLLKKNPPLTVSVCRFDQRLAIYIKKFLPEKFFQKLMTLTYKLES